MKEFIKIFTCNSFLRLFLLTSASVTIFSCGDGSTDPADTDAPVITSGPTVTALDSSATINWVTDEPSDSKVVWGTTSSLSNETVDASLTTSHSVELTDLSPNRLYKYKISSTDASGNEVASDSVSDFFTKHSYLSALAEGWKLFESGEYHSADSLFSLSLPLSDLNAESFSGGGWSKGRLGDSDGAIADFTSGIIADSTNIEILAGIAFAYNASESFEESILFALEVVEKDTIWTFPHDTSVTTNDLILLLAINYFNIADFDSSLFYVQILNPSFEADISIPEGRSELFSEIERLRSFI